MMTLTEWIIASFACWQAIEIWRHGALFAGPRARLEVTDGWFAEMMLCGLCLSPWAAVSVVTTLSLPMPGPDGAWWYNVLAFIASAVVGLMKLVVHALAVSRLANALNDVTHHWCRTPRDLKTVFEIPPEWREGSNGGSSEGYNWDEEDVRRASDSGVEGLPGSDAGTAPGSVDDLGDRVLEERPERIEDPLRDLGQRHGLGDEAGGGVRQPVPDAEDDELSDAAGREDLPGPASNDQDDGRGTGRRPGTVEKGEG